MLFRARCNINNKFQYYKNHQMFSRTLMQRITGNTDTKPTENKPKYPEEVNFDGSSEDNPCTGCPGDSCLYNPDLPRVLAKKISDECLVGTVKPYKMHLVVCRRGTGSSWPSKLENEKSTPSRLNVVDVASTVESLKLSEALGNTVLVTAAERFYNWDTGTDVTEETVQDLNAASDVDEVSKLEGDLELLVFPHGLAFDRITSVAQLKTLLPPLVNMSHDFSVNSYLSLSNSKDEAKAHVRSLTDSMPGLKVVGLVCGHNNRDKRCGVMGPILVDAFRREIADRGLSDNVLIYLASHYGGHKFAGNVVLYELQNLTNKTAGTQRNGHWYGRVSSRHVPVILDKHIRDGKVIQELWRGQMERF